MDRVNDTLGDPYRLQRFVAAQDQGGTYERAIAELRAGAKVSHWMWFVFPQIAGLGLSAIAQEFAISARDEARAYLAHPVLGPRLRECARIVADTEGRSAERIFGPVDAMKLRSSMTLFAATEEEAGENVFRAVLAKYYNGVADEATVSRLLPGGGGPTTRPTWPASQRLRRQPRTPSPRQHALALPARPRLAGTAVVDA
jgi:uncharacterized protein (DUF1810 family)